MAKNFTYCTGVFLFLLVACTNQGQNRRPVENVILGDTTNYFPEFPKLSKEYIRTSRHYSFRFYKDFINRNEYSGSFLVAKNGKIILERITGFSNKRKREKMTPETPLHVASISKVATALMVLRLCDEGLIDLDADINTYLPGIPYNGITVRMLLTHRSGLPYYGYFTYSTWDLGKTMTNSDLLRHIKKHKFRLNYPPGKKFSYCNTNYALLALICENVSGKEFPVLMKERMFDPLKMTNSFIMDKSVDNSKVSQSYNSKWELQKFNYLDAIYGDKNLYTTARDLLKMDMATYSNKFLSDSMRNQMFRGYSYEMRGKANYGLGIRMSEVPGKDTYFFHGGWWHGNTGCYSTLRADTVCIITLSNKYTQSVYTIRSLSPYFGNYPFRQLYEE